MKLAPGSPGGLATGAPGRDPAGGFPLWENTDCSQDHRATQASQCPSLLAVSVGPPTSAASLIRSSGRLLRRPSEVCPARMAPLGSQPSYWPQRGMPLTSASSRFSAACAVTPLSLVAVVPTRSGNFSKFWGECVARHCRGKIFVNPREHQTPSGQAPRIVMGGWTGFAQPPAPSALVYSCVPCSGAPRSRLWL